MAKSLGLQAPCVDIALSVVPGAKGQLFGVKFSLSRRCDNPMARRCAIERASAPRVCALSMVCLRAMGLQRRREKDHAPRQIHVFAAGTATKASCAPGAQEPSEKSIPPFLGQISGTISLKKTCSQETDVIRRFKKSLDYLGKSEKFLLGKMDVSN